MKVSARTSRGLRCAYCHDRLGTVRVCCPDCGARLHVDCEATLGTCPTLGCERVFAARARRRSAWRVWFWGFWAPAGVGALLGLTVLGMFRKPRAWLRRHVATLGAAAPTRFARLDPLLALESPDAMLRIGAVRSLCDDPFTHDAVPALARHLAQDDNVQVRMLVAEGFGRMRLCDPAETLAREALANALRRDPAPAVRRRCAEAMTRYPLADVDALIDALEHDPDLEIRLAAADGLLAAYRVETRPDAVLRIGQALKRARHRSSRAVREKVVQALADDDPDRG